MYKDCTCRVRSVLQLWNHSATFSYSALLTVAMLTLGRSIPCVLCALAVTQSDIAWHALMLILLSQSLLSYQHVPACIYAYMPVCSVPTLVFLGLILGHHFLQRYGSDREAGRQGGRYGSDREAGRQGGRELRSIIDYFLVGKGNRVRVKDVRVVRGAEIGSDHHLVLLKISKTNRREDTDRLRRV